jgi:hypothetical protein
MCTLTAIIFDSHINKTFLGATKPKGLNGIAKSTEINYAWGR